MQQWPIPKDVKALRGFLGLTSYYRKFVKEYGQIAIPLTTLLRKDSFVWTSEASYAFQLLKDAMLALPDFTKPFIVEYDAFGLGVGAILMQNQRPIAFHKQKIETLAQQKWITKLLGYAFIVEYKHGKENLVADALFRRVDSLDVAADIDGVGTLCIISFPNPTWLDGLKSSYVTNPTVQKIIQAIQFGLYFGGSAQNLKDIVLQQKLKSDTCFPAGLLQPLSIPDRPWLNISMDFVEGLPKSHLKSVAFVMVDKLTKYVHFIPLSHTYTAAKVANLFMQFVFKLHVVNKSLEHYLRAFTTDKPQSCVDWLSLAEFWFNTNFHTSLKLTPFEALYGYPPPKVLDYVPGYYKGGNC
nr:uncharacterized protein LOC112026271 [Quercus suber]